MRRLAGYCILFAVCLLVRARLQQVELSDPDHYYHLSIARAFSQEWLPQSLPQVEDLGWKDRFPGQHFLFSASTGLAYWVGGEQGVAVLCFLFALALLLLLVQMGERFLPVQWSLVTTGSLVFLCPYFARRLFAQRPHVLAIFFTLLLIKALLDRRPRLCFLAGLLFSLAYYTQYIPLAVLGLAFVLLKDPLERRAALFGVAGLVIGFFVHPYFPINFESLLLSLPIVLQTNPAQGTAEMIPLSAPEFLRVFGWYLILVLLACFFVGKASEGAKAERLGAQSLFLLLLSCGFWFLGFKAPRAAEYALPVTILLVAGVLRMAPKARRLSPFVLVIGILLSLKEGIAVYWYDASFKDNEWALEVIRSLPKKPGAKVFNCSWSDGALVLYARPDLRVVDLLDPVYLRRSAPLKDSVREQLLRGEVAFPQKPLKEVFGADYVLCGEPILARQLIQDPHFKHLITVPPPPMKRFWRAPVTLFSVSDKPLLPWVRQLESKQRGMDHAWVAQKPNEYLNVGMGRSVKASLFRQESGKVCATFRPVSQESKRLEGARYLGLGGGPYFRAFWNGSLFYQNGITPQAPRALQLLVPLPAKYPGAHELEVEVCGGAESPFMGLSISLWSEDQVKTLCRGCPMLPRHSATPKS